MGTEALTKTSRARDPDVDTHRGKFYGIYAGYVRDRDDPDKLGRVRVYVPAVMPTDAKSSWLDWCHPMANSLFVPPMGAAVWAFCENGQVRSGVYAWGFFRGNRGTGTNVPVQGNEEGDPTWLQKTVTKTAGSGPAITMTMPADTARETKPKYPYNKVIVTEGGHTIEMDDSPTFPRFRYRHPKGTTLLIDSDGSVHVRSAGAQWFEAGGDFGIRLAKGGSFKVIYPNGTGMSLGATGLTVTGHQVTLLGRGVLLSTDVIK